MGISVKLRNKIRRLKALPRKLLLHLSMCAVRIDGTKYRSTHYYLNRLGPTHHENWLDQVLLTILKLRPGTFVDVGANTGQTLLKLLALDPKRLYLGFEPHVAGCFFIEHFLLHNQLTHCRILPFALSNNRGFSKLWVRGTSFFSSTSGAASLVKNFRPEEIYSYWKFVYTLTGDEALSSLEVSSAAVIKIDVEGGELEVVEGFRDTLDRLRPYLIFEVLPYYSIIEKRVFDEKTVRFREKRLRKLESILSKHKYNIYQIWEETEIRRVLQIEPGLDNDLTKTDYLAVPSEEVGSFEKAFSGIIDCPFSANT